MRRIAVLLTAVALVLAACGDDDAAGSDDTTASTVAATTVTSAAPASSTTAAPTTTEAPTNTAMDTALEYEGTYEGEWNNTTFGSSGPIEIEIEVDEAGGFAIITMDLGGFVFGVGDPDPITWEIDLVAGEFLSGDDVFGDTTAEVGDDGSFMITAPEVPGLGGMSMTIEGMSSPDGFNGTYSIPDLAEGTFEAIPSN